ncbi:DUF2927 domain-containing protein [Phormidesmis priestleyi]
MRSLPLVRAVTRHPMLIGFISTLIPIVLVSPSFSRPISSSYPQGVASSYPQGVASSYPQGVVPQPSSFLRSAISTPEEYTQEQIRYFMEVAMGTEYSSVKDAAKVRKWQEDLRIQVLGTPTKADLETLKTVVSEINELTAGTIRLQLVAQNPNVTIHFAPEWKFKQLEPNYQPVNYGYFWTRWNHDTITSANILITSKQVTQKERSHLIREELTQALGLMQDSNRYADSMFYQPWTDVTQYSSLDRALIKMLYSPQIRPGMTQAQVIGVLNSLQAQTRSTQCDSKGIALEFGLNSTCVKR